MRLLGSIWLWWVCSTVALAADLSVRIVNDAGVPLANAVVFVADTEAKAPVPGRKRTVIVQRNRVFQPFVTVVQRGAAIDFPNEDPFMHHVYSFSPAKHFEIKLYRGTPGAPVVFDKTGVVVVGCNVHDWMIAYILVVDTPLYAKAGADGKLRLDNLTVGRYPLMVWYPGMREPATMGEVVLQDAESKSIEYKLKTPVRKQPPAPPHDPLRY